MTQLDPVILNEAVLDELTASVQGDRMFVVELIEAYLADGEHHVADAEAAIAAGDAAALVRPAHTLKSSSATVGADRMAATARALESIGRSGSIDATARDQLTALREAWSGAGDALRAWVARGNAS